MSNKIFIGDPEEDAVTEPTVVVDDAQEEEEEEDKSSRFSSFPIRGLNTLAGPKGNPLQVFLLGNVASSKSNIVAGSGNGLLPFRPRKSPFLHFGRNHKVEKEEEEKEEEEVEEKTGAPALDLGGDEEGETTVTEKPEETSTRAFNPVRMRDNRKR